MSSVQSGHNVIGPEIHVTPTGSASGKGTAADPLDIMSVLSRSRPVIGGALVSLHEGTYTLADGFIYAPVGGTADAPVIIRGYPGEHATVVLGNTVSGSGGLVCSGAHAWFRDFEVKNIDTDRISTQSSGELSWPTDVPKSAISIEARGPYSKFINLVVHDLGGGYGSWEESPGSEIYGNLIYNNGWQGTDRGHGHGIYIQNHGDWKRVIDNFIFNNFGNGINCYGSGFASVRRLHFEGNVSAGAGSVAEDYKNSYVIGASSANEELNFFNNESYFVTAATAGAHFGYPGSPARSIKVMDNYLVGQVRFDGLEQVVFQRNTVVGADSLMTVSVPWLGALPTGPAYDWDNNTYYRTPTQAFQAFNVALSQGWTPGWQFAEWQWATGFDPSSTLVSTAPTGTRIVIRPNRYQQGRANVTIYSWDSVSPIAVDLSSILYVGQTYVVRSAYDFYGTPVVSGTYAGGTVNFPMTGLTPPAVIGGSTRVPAADPKFNMFVVIGS